MARVSRSAYGINAWPGAGAGTTRSGNKALPCKTDAHDFAFRARRRHRFDRPPGRATSHAPGLQAPPLAINPSLFAKLPYNALTDVAPIALMTRVPNVISVHPSLPARTLKKRLALAKVRPIKWRRSC